MAIRSEEMYQLPIALTKKELHEITGYKTAQKQINALVSMGIPFKIRPNGTPFVARPDISMTLESSGRKYAEPKLNLI
jgi:hypothetical protein